MSHWMYFNNVTRYYISFSEISLLVKIHILFLCSFQHGPQLNSLYDSPCTIYPPYSYHTLEAWAWWPPPYPGTSIIASCPSETSGRSGKHSVRFVGAARNSCDEEDGHTPVCDMASAKCGYLLNKRDNWHEKHSPHTETQMEQLLLL